MKKVNTSKILYRYIDGIPDNYLPILVYSLVIEESEKSYKIIPFNRDEVPSDIESYLKNHLIGYTFIIRKSAKNQKYFDTKQDALRNYIIRKKCELNHLLKKIENVEKYLISAKEILDESK